VYIPTLAIQAILTEVSALAIFEKHFKPPVLFLPFLPLTCVGKNKKKKKNNKRTGNAPPFQSWQELCMFQEHIIFWRKPSISLELLELIP